VVAGGGGGPVLKKAMIPASVLLVLFLTAAGGFYYIFTTEKGLKWSVDFLLDHYIQAQEKHVGRIRGSLSTFIILEDVTLKNLQGLPAGTVRVQQLVLVPHGLNYQNAQIRVFNARLMLAYSDNIVLNGTYKARRLDLNIFSSGIEVSEICRMASVKGGGITGIIKGIDMQVTGTISKARLKGAFDIEKLSGKDFTLSQTPVTLDLEITDPAKRPGLIGHVDINKGALKSRNTKITLKKSGVYFHDDPQNPALSIDAYSRIEDIAIDISVKGTLKNPDLKLSSDPALNSEILMVMLATGKKWQGIENLEQGKMTPDLAADFVGYLFFSGGDDSFLDKLGVTHVKVIYQNGSKGLGLTKEITDNLDIGYEVGQNTQTQTASGLFEQLGADYRIANQLYFSIDKQMGYVESNTGGAPENGYQFFLKYKKQF
jgi:hypothetical protein